MIGTNKGNETVPAHSGAKANFAEKQELHIKSFLEG